MPKNMELNHTVKASDLHLTVNVRLEPGLLWRMKLTRALVWAIEKIGIVKVVEVSPHA